jgi:hypothetical protein
VTRSGVQELVRIGWILAVRKLLGHVANTVVPDVGEQTAISDQNAVDVEHEGLERHFTECDVFF